MYVFECACVCVHTNMGAGTFRSHNLLELELQAIVNSWMWVLGTEPLPFEQTLKPQMVFLSEV